MQLINLTLDVPVTDSCSGCFCCFPFKKDKKKSKDKTSNVAENYFMEKKISDEYEVKQIHHVSNASNSESIEY